MAMNLLLNLQNNTDTPQSVSLMNPQNQSAIGTAPNTFSTFSYDMTSEIASAITNNFTTLFITLNSTFYNLPYTTYYLSQGSTIQSIADVVTLVNQLAVANNLNFSAAVDGNTDELIIQNQYYYFSSITISENYPTSSQSELSYGIFGTLIYSAGFSNDGSSGTVTRISPSNTFWINSVPNTTDGGLNRTALWNNSMPANNYFGFITTLNSTTAKTVYLAIASDDTYTFYVNNTLVMAVDNTAMNANIVSQLGVGFDNAAAVCFTWWQIFPIQLVQGQNIIQCLNNNNPVSQGAFGVEIYDNTAAQIAAATSYAGLNVLYSTKDNVGMNFF